MPKTRRKMAKRTKQLKMKKKVPREKDRLLKKLTPNEKISSNGPSLIQNSSTILSGMKKLRDFTWKLTRLMTYKE